MQADKPKILTIAGYYLPAYKAGGPVRTIANMVDWLGDDFQFHIIAEDRDLGDSQPFQGISVRTWRQVGKAQVLYLPRSDFGLLRWRSLLRSLDYDLVYLNSFFSRLTINTLVLMQLGLLVRRPIILAPRGQFSPGALVINKYKKRLYIATARLAGLYEHLTWQASSQYEAQEIQAGFGDNLMHHKMPIVIAPNLPERHPRPVLPDLRPEKISGEAQVVFLSRISRKKNLNTALRLLAEVAGRVDFDIYGPQEDIAYWQECETLIRQLPDTVKVTYRGAITPDKVMPTFAQYHLFLFPTHGENFGHVILEALRAGCPVLVSDQTPWRDLTQRKAGWDVSLSQWGQFRSALSQLIAMNNEEFAKWSASARVLADSYSIDTTIVEANRRLFLEAATR